MNTPITDSLFGPMWAMDGPPTDIQLHEAQKSHRRLELDRAALMEALEKATSGFIGDTTGYFHVNPSNISFARAALSAARANFPTE